MKAADGHNALAATVTFYGQALQEYQQQVELLNERIKDLAKRRADEGVADANAREALQDSLLTLEGELKMSRAANESLAKKVDDWRRAYFKLSNKRAVDPSAPAIDTGPPLFEEPLSPALLHQDDGPDPRR